ncbi:MAG: NAD(+) synthase [Treponemataceae bacterium]|nr:NAD(+) synthase [Treponemataceae bacterium]
MEHGFFRAACASPAVTVADCGANAAAIVALAREAAANGARLVVFPELCITAYTCGDLFLQRTLLDGATDALRTIMRETADTDALVLVGLPFVHQDALYNCAALLFRGKVIALVPKSYIPAYGEFYERRHFAPASPGIQQVSIDGENARIPFGTNILIADTANPLFVLGTEICEDLWVPLPPSVHAALAGATVIANLSASNEVIGKADYRRMLVASQSARLAAAYLYADSGNGESTTDLVFAAHNLLAENGTVLAESSLFSQGITYTDFDLERIAQERKRMTTFADCARNEPHDFVTVTIDSSGAKKTADNAPVLLRTVAPRPFVPDDMICRAERCHAVIALQAQGLAKRLRHLNCRCAVIGLSGGLDSTLALLVTVRAFALCGLAPSLIRAVTMPCFGTTDRTHRNARALAAETGATLMEIPIADAVRQHFQDIGQDETVHDITYENCQARERTQVLMDVANKYNGIVIGTGDLSELALGWATYNGDHMSMYGVNASVPKTLVRHLVTSFADEAETQARPALAAVLRNILDTPVSPELLPPDGTDIAQKTEELVGPYELHDFFLYYALRFGFSPAKIFFLAEQAFITQSESRGEKPLYDKAAIKAWLVSFYRRFFAQQFKRSCLPDGAKVGTVSLSPRGDWRMPSDASARLWLSQAEALEC